MRLPAGLNTLERQVIELLVEGSSDERAILRQQYQTIYLVERKWKVTGYHAVLSFDRALPTTSEYDDYDLEGVSGLVSGELCDFTLSIFDGRIFLLYCETGSKAPWPDPAVLEKVFRSE